MKEDAVSRRTILAAGGFALAGMSGSAIRAEQSEATTPAGSAARSEAVVRRYYKAWEIKDWAPMDALLEENFTFTSANNDDHISKSVFKTRCWETQIDFIDHFDIEHLIARGDEAFVKYTGRTRNGKSFQNVEYLRLDRQKIAAIECYFGSQSSFASAAGGR